MMKMPLGLEDVRLQAECILDLALLISVEFETILAS